MKKQSTGRYVCVLDHYLHSEPNKSFFFLLSVARLAKNNKFQFYSFWFDSDRALNLRSATLEASALVITPEMRLGKFFEYKRLISYQFEHSISKCDCVYHTVTL